MAPSTSSRHNNRQLRLRPLDHVRDSLRCQRRSSYGRPPTPYPHQASVTYELLTPYRIRSRFRNLYVRPRWVETVTVVQRPRFSRSRAVVVEVESRLVDPRYDGRHWHYNRRPEGIASLRV